MTDASLPIEVSVVIAAFNAERTLGAQLAALARQDVAFGWEILVCDNGSTDGTAELVRQWQGRLPQLRLIDASARRGPSAARNVGVSFARGLLLLFCDADDVVADDWALQMHRALQGADFVAGARRYTLLNAAATGPTDWVDPLFTMPFLPQLPAAATSNLGVKAAVFEEAGGLDETLLAAEDIDLCWRLQLAGYPLIAQPAAIVQIRRRHGLRSVFRQAYAYGVGDKTLLHKYGDVIASMPVTGEHDAPVRSVFGFARGLFGKVFRRRRPADLMFAVDRLGRRMGTRFGYVDEGAPKVAVPGTGTPRRSDG